MTDSHLFSPYRLGSLELKNRAVMAPMTRSRSIGNVPGELVAKYYAQRAEAGLIITEGTSPSPDGLGYARIPGLFSNEHVAAWKRVTDRVHAEGSRIFVQLMHSGRVGHLANLPVGGKVLGPSAIAAPGQMHTDAHGPQPFPVPTSMTADDIESAIVEHAHAAALAMEAGFDGVELHAANGYLLEQFLNLGANQRTDDWGGSVGNRVRFALEVVSKTITAIGAHRVGIRVSPYGVFNGSVSDAQTDDVYRALAEGLSTRGVLYVHTVDHSTMGTPAPSPQLYAEMRRIFSGTRILSGGYDLAHAEHDLAEGLGDLVAFGRPFLANPRLLSRLKSGEPLQAPDMTKLYTPGEAGYTDWA